MSAATSGMEAPKAAKRRKLTDKTLPSTLHSFEEARLYAGLLEAERKLDWTMSRKKMEIHDAFSRVAMVPKTLRIFLSHYVEGQLWQSGGEGGAMSSDINSLDFASGQGIPSWTFKVEGRLLDTANLNPRVSVRKFTSFLKGMVIEFDRDPAIYPDGNIVEWRGGTVGHADQDGFKITRRGDVPVVARVILHLKRQPERFKLIDPLADILDMKEETRPGIITALWHYIKVNGLQDKVDRRIIRPDMKLRPIFGVDQVTFQQLPDIVNRCLKPVDPVVIPYIINVDSENGTGLQAYDVEVTMDDSVLKAKMNAVHAPNEPKRLAALDDEIAIAAQAIRSSKTKLDFLSALAADPRNFVKTWLESQSRDLDVVLGNEQGVSEEDLKNSQFFAMPWVEEAVSVQEGLRVTNAIRTQQGTMG